MSEIFSLDGFNFAKAVVDPYPFGGIRYFMNNLGFNIVYPYNWLIIPCY